MTAAANAAWFERQRRQDKSRKRDKSALDRLMHVLISGEYDKRGSAGLLGSPESIDVSESMLINSIDDVDGSSFIEALRDEFREDVRSLLDGADDDERWEKFFPYRHGTVRDLAEHIESLVQQRVGEAEDLVSEQRAARKRAVGHADQGGSRATISVNVCYHLAAIISAVDGRLSRDEIKHVLAALGKSASEEVQEQERFVKLCRKVHKEGVQAWADKMCDELRKLYSTDPSREVTADSLFDLLHRITSAGGEQKEAQLALISRFRDALVQRLEQSVPSSTDEFALEVKKMLADDLGIDDPREVLSTRDFWIEAGLDDLDGLAFFGDDFCEKYGIDIDWSEVNQQVDSVPELIDFLIKRLRALD